MTIGDQFGRWRASESRSARTQRHAGLTVDYRPPQSKADVPRLAVVAGSGPAATSELTALLRRRLLFLALLFGGLFGIVTPLVLSRILLGVPGPTVVVSAGIVLLTTFTIMVLLATILWRRTAWTLGQLRTIELILVGTLVFNYAYRSCTTLWSTGILPHAVGLIDTGPDGLVHDLTAGLNHYVYMSWALLIIAYGIFIPNRWQRCALVVGFMAVVAIGLRTVAYVMSGLPMDDWNNLSGSNGGLSLLIAVAIAIYGAIGSRCYIRTHCRPASSASTSSTNGSAPAAWARSTWPSTSCCAARAPSS